MGDCGVESNSSASEGPATMRMIAASRVGYFEEGQSAVNANNGTEHPVSSEERAVRRGYHWTNLLLWNSSHHIAIYISQNSTHCLTLCLRNRRSVEKLIIKGIEKQPHALLISSASVSLL